MLRSYRPPHMTYIPRYAFNIVFNILNKSALMAFPCPWLISAWQLRKCSTEQCSAAQDSSAYRTVQ